MKTTLEVEVQKAQARLGQTGSFDRQILRALRRIVRAIDIYSRELKRACGLTVPQLVCLTAIVDQSQLTIVALSIQVHLSPSTLVGIVDRLETAGLVVRARSSEDRRQVLITPTMNGIDAIRQAPSPLQGRLVTELAMLPVSEQATIAKSLDKIVELMDVHEMRVAPLLTLERKSYAATRKSKTRANSMKNVHDKSS